MSATEGKPKILFVSNTAFYLHNFRRGLMKALRESGFVIIAAAPYDEFSERLEREGFRVIRIKRLNRKGINPFEDVRLTLELINLYRREKPSLVLHFTVKPNIYGTIACRIIHTKSICNITGLGYLFIDKSFLNNIAMHLYRTALAGAYRVFFQNRDDQDFFVRLNLVKRDKTLLTRGSGLDADFFSPDISEKMETRNHNTIFLMSSRMLWHKGVGEFVEAAKMVKESHVPGEFWLLGGVDKGNPAAVPEGRIQGWVAEGIVKYLGMTDDVRPFIAECDVVVLPSYREGIPRSLIEGMAMGKPIITTDTIGCKEVVDEGKNGFLVPTRDPRALAEAMIGFVNLRPEERKEMGRYSRGKAVSEFNEKRVIDLYLQTIRECMRESQGF